MINDCDLQIFKKIPDITNTHNQLSFNTTFVPFESILKTEDTTQLIEEKKIQIEFKKDILKINKDIQQKSKYLEFLTSNSLIHLQKLQYKDQEIQTYSMMVERKKQLTQKFNQTHLKLNQKLKAYAFKCSQMKQQLQVERKNLRNIANQKIKEQAQLLKLQEKIETIQSSLQINSVRFTDLQSKLNLWKKMSKGLGNLQQKKHFLEKQQSQQTQKHRQYTQHKQKFIRKIQQLEQYVRKKQIINRKLVTQLKFHLNNNSSYVEEGQFAKQASIQKQLGYLKGQQNLLINQIKQKDYQIKQFNKSIQLKIKEVNRLKDTLLPLYLKKQSQDSSKQQESIDKMQINQNKFNEGKMNRQPSGITTQKKQFFRKQQISKQEQLKNQFYKQNKIKQSKVDHKKHASEEMLRIISRYQAILDRADV